MAERLDCAVWMVTYNHESYVRQAIDSVLAQQTKFNFCIYIGDDCSTDSTAAICTEYADRFPEKIFFHRHEKNIGANANGIYMYNVCLASGAKYTALLEGDDFWTDVTKLEKQISLLEAAPGFAGCFHDGIVVDEKNNVTKDHWVPLHRSIIQKDVLMYGATYQSCSLIFRTELIAKFPPALSKVYGGDRLISISLTDSGDLAFLSSKMCAYRRHSAGMYSSTDVLTKSERQYSDFLLIAELVPLMNKHQSLIRSKLAENISVMTYCYSQLGRRKGYWGLVLEYIRHMPWNWFSFKRLLSHVLFPGIYRKLKGPVIN